MSFLQNGWKFNLLKMCPFNLTNNSTIKIIYAKILTLGLEIKFAHVDIHADYKKNEYNEKAKKTGMHTTVCAIDVQTTEK